MIRYINRLLRLNKSSEQRGGLMVEAIAMLGMIAMVTPMLFKKSQERANEISDISIANHMRMIMRGVDDYIRSNHADIKNGNTVSYASCTPTDVDYSGALPTTDVVQIGHFCQFLPVGYQDLAPSILGSYRVSIRREDVGGETIISAVLATEQNGQLTQLRSTRVASMIGAHGGNVRPASNTKMTGNQDAWELDIGNYFTGAWLPGENSIVVTSSYTGVSDTSEFLYRTDVGYEEFNTMLTDLHMADNDIEDVDHLIVSGTGAGTDHGITVENGGIVVELDDIDVTAGNITVAAGDIEATSGNITAGATVTGLDLVGTNSLDIGGGDFTVDADGNVVGAGTANFTGDVTAGANLQVDGNTTIDGTATVTGLLTASGGADVTGDLDVSGATNTGTLNTTGLATVDSLDVTNNADIHGDLTVDGTATLTDLNLTGDLDVNGNTETDTLDVLGNATVGDSLIVTNGITSTNGDIDSGGNVTADDYIYALYDGVSDYEFGVDNLGGTANDTNRMYLRKGFVEVTADTDMKAEQGFIQVPRMVTDEAFTLPIATLDCSSGTCSVTSVSTVDPEGYDRYQVNPAYTSVMKDIKLASRGGARLSEILPDFINKGIFVLDNTYKQYWHGTNTTAYTGGSPDSDSYGRADVNGDGFINGSDQVDTDGDNIPDADAWLLNWSGSNCGSTGSSDCKPPVDFASNKLYVSSAEECESDTFACQTSPWMGFIPAPICPTNYAAIVTMSPVRWRSGRSYAQGVDSTTLGDSLEISPDRDKAATFQTNTWTALTVEAYCEDNAGGSKSCASMTNTDIFFGWSGMMGFLYPFDDDDPPDGVADQIAWNVWPVNNKELSAIANIYCLFMRRNPGFAGVPRWDPDVVDVSYDQLRNFRYAGDYGVKTNTDRATTQNIGAGNLYSYSFDGTNENTKGLYDPEINVDGTTDTTNIHTYVEPWN